MRHGNIIHRRGLLERVLEHLRGRDQLLVRPGDELPLLVLSYPRGNGRVAQELESAYLRILPLLHPRIRQPYAAVFRNLLSVVVVQLRPVNICGCLGHHHPRGTESRFARRIAHDLGGPVGEIDLAFNGIREWRPQPLSALASQQPAERLATLQFPAALLAVMLHEFEHLAFPEHSEQEVRSRSNRFYSEAMEELVSEELGAVYGVISGPPRS